jgi:DNA invertase Pin-like site-specific DNA recombinase
MKGDIKAAIYARVSTRKGQDPKMQIRELREYCRRRGWQIASEYIDHGVSGAKDTRPALDRLMQDCRKRLIDAVIVYRYDRFARSLRFLVNALSEFDSLGIQFISLHESVDTGTPNGRLIFGIFASISEFERGLLSERIRSGLETARAQGKRLGRPPRMLSEDLIAKLRRDRSNGRLSLRELARKHSISVWRAYIICSQQRAEV